MSLVWIRRQSSLQDYKWSKRLEPRRQHVFTALKIPWYIQNSVYQCFLTVVCPSSMLENSRDIRKYFACMTFPKVRAWKLCVKGPTKNHFFSWKLKLSVFVSGCKHRAKYALFWRGFLDNNCARLFHWSLAWKVKVWKLVWELKKTTRKKHPCKQTMKNKITSLWLTVGHTLKAGDRWARPS